MSDTNGQPVPVLDGIPIVSQPSMFKWNLYKVGRDDNGEDVWLLRLAHATGISEFWAPASFMRDWAEKIALTVSPLTIARDLPPDPPG